jgi:hypothetical protein
VVTQDDVQASLCLVTKTSPGCRGLFHPRGDKRKVTYANHVRCMVGEHTWIEHGKRVTC